MSEQVIINVGGGFKVVFEYTVLGSERIKEETPSGPVNTVQEIRQLEAIRIEGAKTKPIRRYDELRVMDLKKMQINSIMDVTAGIVTCRAGDLVVQLDEEKDVFVRRVLTTSEKVLPYPTEVSCHWGRQQHPESPDKLGKR